MVGGTINLALNWNSADNFWQGLGYFGVGAAAGVATAAIGSAGGLAVLEAATFSGVAAGAITGGGNVAMQGGGAADIFAGAVGGALIGGSTAFLGGAAMMGLGEIASNISVTRIRSVVSDGGLKLSNNMNLLDVYNGLTGGIGGASGGFGGVGAGNLFQFASYNGNSIYKAGMESYYFSKGADMRLQGIGVHASYHIKGHYNVYQSRGGSWKVDVTGLGITTADQFGSVDFFGGADLLVNGKIVSSESFNKYNEYSLHHPITHPMGRLTFNLPAKGNVQLRIRGAYRLNQGTGIFMPTPFDGNYNMGIINIPVFSTPILQSL